MQASNDALPFLEHGNESILNDEIRTESSLHGCRTINANEEICIPCRHVLYWLVFPVPRKEPPRETLMQRIMRRRTKKGNRRNTPIHEDSAKQFDHVWSDRWDDTPIGWLDRLIATTRCELCQFFVRMLLICSPSFKPETFSAQHRCMLSIDNSRYDPHSQRPGYSEIALRFDEYTGAPLERRPVMFLLERGFLSFSVVPESVEHLIELLGQHDQDTRRMRDTRSSSHSTILAEYCNLADMRFLYDNCRTSHGDDCEKVKSVFENWAKRQRPSQPQLVARFVDVNSLSIVECQATEYFALSYCWSTQPYATLTRSNIKQLKLPGSLANASILPSIEDAINLTKVFGKACLWG